MNGTFRVPPQQPFLDFLTLGTLGVQILKLTRVRVPNEPDVVPFVALRRESVILVVPTLSKDLIEEPDSGFMRARDVACLLPGAPVAIVNLTQAVGMSEMQ